MLDNAKAGVMKIVTWNCNGALRKKLPAIDELDADLLVIQECESPEHSLPGYRDWAGDFLWHGESKHKGIGIFPRGNVSIARLDWDADGLQSFLPCVVNDSFTLIAVWTKYANSPNFRYIGQLWKYLQKHKAKLVDTPFVLCGDLNSNKCWDEWDRWWNHSDVVRELDEIGTVSLYHDYFGESQGEESRPTLFFTGTSQGPTTSTTLSLLHRSGDLAMIPCTWGLTKNGWVSATICRSSSPLLTCLNQRLKRHDGARVARLLICSENAGGFSGTMAPSPTWRGPFTTSENYLRSTSMRGS